MRHHLRGRSGAQHVGVINVGSAQEDRVHQRQHLAARRSATDTTVESHRRIDQRLEIEPLTQRRGQQQPGVGDEIAVVEGDVNAVQGLRYSTHWKCLLSWLQDAV